MVVCLQGALTSGAIFTLHPPPTHAEGRARNGQLTSFPAVKMLSPALRHTPPWPLPDRQRAGGTEPPCGVVFGTPLGRGAGSWRSLSFPRGQ